MTHRHPGLVHSPPPLTQGPSRRSGRVSRHPRACSQAALTLLNNGPKHTSRDAGSPALPKRGRGELPLSAKARVCACVCVSGVTRCLQGLALSAASGIHRRPWNVSSADKQHTKKMHLLFQTFETESACWCLSCCRRPIRATHSCSQNISQKSFWGSRARLGVCLVSWLPYLFTTMLLKPSSPSA